MTYYRFTWNNDKSKLYYIESSPHFAVEKTRDKIVDNKGNVYFESESGTSLLNELALSDDERTFAFFIDYENDRNLFVGKIGQYKKLHKITEISIDVGKIKFEDNSICVLKNNSAIKARFDLSEYIEK